MCTHTTYCHGGGHYSRIPTLPTHILAQSVGKCRSSFKATRPTSVVMGRSYKNTKCNRKTNARRHAGLQAKGERYVKLFIVLNLPLSNSRSALKTFTVHWRDDLYTAMQVKILVVGRCVGRQAHEQRLHGTPSGLISRPDQTRSLLFSELELTGTSCHPSLPLPNNT